MKRLKIISLGSLTIIFLLLVFGNFQGMLAAITNDVSVMVLPGAPEHAAVTLNTATPEYDVTLTWDASPSLPADIVSHTVFYKRVTDPGYPVTPQITRTDALPSYSETIAITSGVSYNFIVFANSVSGIRSTQNCASCFVTYNASSGGGSTIVNVDSINPTPGTAVSPAYTNTTPITVTYSGASDTGGSGLSNVELLAKKGTAGWVNTGLTSSGSSGSFEYAPADIVPNMTYYFDLLASDNQGNQSASPTATGDTSTVYEIQPPIINKITVPTSAISTPILISYENAVDVGLAGLNHVELWYKKGATGTWTDSGLTGITASGAFNFENVTDSDAYYFDLIAVDKAGNRSIEDGETKTPTLYDDKAPILGSVTIPAASNVSPIVIGYTGAVDVGPAGLKTVELWSKKEASGVWGSTGLTAAASNGTFNFTPSTNGTYYFAMVLEDNFGNRSLAPSGSGTANVVYTAKPVVAVLSNLPASTIEVGSIDIVVGGDGVTAYKYRMNAAAYGAEIPITQNITLTNLAEGSYALNVLGKNSANVWQATNSPTLASWTVAFPVVTAPPVADEGEPAETTPPPATETTPPPATETTPPPATETTPPPATETTPPPATETTPPPAEETTGPKQPSGSSVSENVQQPSVETPTTEAPASTETPPTTPTVPVVEFSPIVVEKTPEIAPPAPAVRYSAEEIGSKAADVIVQAEKAPATIPATISLPKTPQLVLTRVDECRLEYPTVNFDSASLDSDGDGLSNKTECYALTNPVAADTDGDLCLDGDEVNQYATDPLNSKDCTPDQKTKNISISSPQSGWLLAELEVTGLTPDTSSQVTLTAFPVVDGVVKFEDAVDLGTVNQFNPSKIEGQYFFRMTPKAQLTDGQTYDLVAIGVLADGTTITSPAVRFSLDSKSGALPPIPISIGNVPITEDLKLSNIQVKPDPDGKIRVVGESEFGAQVFAVWESIVLASSVIADSALGEFTMESPDLMTPGQNHQVILYAVKEQDGLKMRSKDVKISFYIQKPTVVPYKAMATGAGILAVAGAAAFLLHGMRLGALKRRGKEEEEIVK